MNLKIYQPSDVFLDETATKVVAEGAAGSFAVLPRHIDMATALIPGILAYETGHGREMFVALDGGIFIKQGDQVSVATRMAIRGELGELQAAVDRFMDEADEKEKIARSAVAKLEADLVRRFVEFGKND